MGQGVMVGHMFDGVLDLLRFGDIDSNADEEVESLVMHDPVVEPADLPVWTLDTKIDRLRCSGLEV